MTTEERIDKYLIERKSVEDLFRMERNPKPGFGWKVTRTWYVADAKNANMAIQKTKKYHMMKYER